MRAMRFAVMALTVGWGVSRGEEPPRVDRYGDPLPAGAVMRLGTVRWRAGVADRLAYSPDGKTILTSAGTTSADVRSPYAVPDAVRLWDRATGREAGRWRLPVSGKVARIADFHAGQKVIAFYRRGGGFAVWYVGQETLRWSRSNGFNYLTFSPAGNRLTSWRADKGLVYVWETLTGVASPLGEAAKESRAPEFVGRRAFVYSQDQRFLAALLDERTVHVWDLRPRKEVFQRAVKRPHRINAIALSPDGKVLAACLSREIILWAVPGGRELRRITMKDGFLNRVAFSPDSRTLAVSKPLRLWDVATGKPRPAQPADGDGPMKCLTFSPDGKELAALQNSTVRRWEVATGKAVPVAGVHRGSISELAFGPRGTTLASLGNDGRVAAWDIRTGKGVWHESGHSHYCQRGLAVSPDGKTLAALANGGKTIALRDLAAGRSVRSLRHMAEVSLLAFAPDGQSLCSVTKSDRGEEWHQWQVAAGKETRRVLLPPVKQSGAQGTTFEYNYLLSPDGRFAIPGIWNRHAWGPGTQTAPEIIGRELPSGKELPPVRLSGDPKSSVNQVRGTFSADGRTLALAIRSGKVQFQNSRVILSNALLLVEVATGQERARLDDPGVDVSNATLATDGRLLAYCDEPYFEKSPIRVWDASTAKEVGKFQQTDNVVCLAFSPDRKTLASGLADSTTLVWDLASVNEKLHPETKELSARELDGLWADLAGADAAKAFQAIHRLAAAPKQAVPFLGKHLRPVPAGDEKRIGRLIEELNSDTFDVRQKAERELAALAERAGPALRRTLDDKPSLEVRRRVERLLAPLGRWQLAGEDLGRWRALEALERIGTPEARRVLQTLADGAPDAWQTREAKSSLLRLAGPAARR